MHLLTKEDCGMGRESESERLVKMSPPAATIYYQQVERSDGSAQRSHGSPERSDGSPERSDENEFH